MESSSAIVQLFAHVAERPDQCYEFDIQGNLNRFVEFPRNQQNFSEAAFLICDAARIYGRKVDYVEQILLDFNRRSAANVANAERQRELELAKNGESEKEHTGDGAKKDKAKEAAEKREREKEKAIKRAKRMCKVTSKIEFKPKPFTIGTPLQISLNLHEEKSELDLEDDYDQVRMKNVFPRINVLQSNLQNNNTFYDNLNIVDEHCENVDALRDFRIFMDTIDEPIYMRPNKNNADDPQYEEECNRARQRANQKHSNLYLSAEYVKENYGVTLKDNSDYLNMLKYNEEVERLNLRKLSIEQLTKLKVGTYLNNILHGNKNDGKIPEHDSGIDDMYGDGDCEMPEISANEADSLLDDTIDAPTTTDESLMNTTNELNTTTELDTTNEIDMTNGTPSANTTLDSSTEQPNTSSTDSSNLESSTELNSSCDQSGVQSCETSKANESELLDRSQRQSLDDGLGGSISPGSPSRLSEFGGFDSADLSETNVNMINDMLHSAEDQNAEILEAPPMAKQPKLESNIFALPEKLLRRPRLFQLTEEFDLWLAARKRKVGLAAKEPTLANFGKLLKLSSGDFVRTDADSDIDEFLGFDEHNEMHLAHDAVVVVEQPAIITNRTCSSDSGISPEKLVNPDDLNKTTPNDTLGNDSGVADLDSSEGLDNTKENIDQTITDSITDASNVSDANIVANSTKIFNETASILTGMDSGFEEMNSQITTNENDTTFNGETTTNADDFDAIDEPENISPIIPIDEPLFRDETAQDKGQPEDETGKSDDVCDMVERVSKWHEMLRPVLQTCEKRNNFDIHALGSDIMNLFPETQQSNEITFADVMKDRDQSYTARYFLSLLLLTNNKNVQLSRVHPEENGDVICSNEDIQIKFRSKNRHLDEVNKMDKHLDESQIRVGIDGEGEGEAAAVAGTSQMIQMSGKKPKAGQKRKRNT